MGWLSGLKQRIANPRTSKKRRAGSNPAPTASWEIAGFRLFFVILCSCCYNFFMAPLPFQVEKLGIVLRPTKNNFESKAVLNPAVYQEGEFVHLFYRAVDRENRSSIGYAKLQGPIEVVERWERPILTREHDYEKRGVEDPRLVKIEDTYYLTYVAHDGKNAVTAYATSQNLKDWEKGGIISARIPYHQAIRIFEESKTARLKDAYYFFASYYEELAGKGVLLWHKDLLLFPEKFNGRFAMLHRVLPDIQIVFFKDFKELTTSFWKNYLANLSSYVILENKHWFESRNIGGGAPPIETSAGWLIIIHTVEELNRGRVYHASAALLDREDPKKVIGKLHEPLFSPTEEWEKTGFTNNVVFPTGTATFGEKLYIYYGAADKYIAAAALNLEELIAALKNPALGH